MQKPKFDLRRLRDQQLARLRSRATRLGTPRRLRDQAALPRAVQAAGNLPARLAQISWREYLVPGIALLMLFVALFLSKVTPPANNASTDPRPTDFGEIAEAPTIVGETPTITADVGETPTITGNDAYPFAPEDATIDLLSPTPVPTSDVLTGTADLPLPYPDPGDLNEPFPFGTAPSIDGLPTPPVAGGDDPFATPFVPAQDGTPSAGTPPADNGGFAQPPTAAPVSPTDDGGYPSPGSALPPPVFPTTPPSVPVRPPTVVIAPSRPNPPPVVVAPSRPNPTTGVTRRPTATPANPFEELPGGYPPPAQVVPATPRVATPTTRGAPGSVAPAQTPTTRSVSPPTPAQDDGTTPPTEQPQDDGTTPPAEQPSAPPLPTTPAPTATSMPSPTPTPAPVTRIESATRWTIEQSPIVVDRDQVIVPGASLEIDPGVEVRLKPNVHIYVEGRLAVAGAAGNPVRFSGPEGRWGALVGQPGSSISLGHAEIRNAGRGGVGVSSTGGQLTIHDSQIVDGGGGIVASGSAVDIRNTQVVGNDLSSGPAVNITLGAQSPATLHGNIFGGNLVSEGTPQVRLIAGNNGSGPIEIIGNAFTSISGPLLDLQTASAIGGTIRCNGFQAGSVGLQLRSSTPNAAGFSLAVDNNAFEGQAVNGAASTVALDAPNNWWGDPTGPTDAVRNPEGRGVRAGVNVTFSPWLQSRPGCAPTP
jgi:hypothetical protein